MRLYGSREAADLNDWNDQKKPRKLLWSLKFKLQQFRTLEAEKRQFNKSVLTFTFTNRQSTGSGHCNLGCYYTRPQNNCFRFFGVIGQISASFGLVHLSKKSLHASDDCLWVWYEPGERCWKQPSHKFSNQWLYHQQKLQELYPWKHYLVNYPWQEQHC